MKAQPSPLECHGYFVTELLLRANPDYKKDQETNLSLDDLNIEATAKKIEGSDNNSIWQVQLRMNQKVDADKNSPYNFAISLVGHFSVHPKFPADQHEKMAKVNSSSVLFSAARQILHDAMANGPFDPLLLPMVSFANWEPDQPEKAEETE